MTISALGGMQGTGLGLGVGKGRDRVSHWTNDMTRAPGFPGTAVYGMKTVSHSIYLISLPFHSQWEGSGLLQCFRIFLGVMEE